ncbi:SAM-dependent methyltransferase [Deferrisoma palaeochoriense]
MAHPVYFIGAGPGSPDYLTLEGARALEESPSVLAPASFQRSFAGLLAGKDLESPFALPHAEVVAWIEARLPRGPVGVLIPGDFSVFCPFQSFVAAFGDRARVIPGVGAHAAAAALLKKTFDLPEVAHATVITSPRAFGRGGGSVRLRDFARPGTTLVLYMNDRPLPELATELRAGFGKDVPIAILENIGCPDERVTLATLDTVVEAVGDRDPFGVDSSDPEPALALVVAGEVLARDEDPSWWDRRYETVWKPRGMR